MRARNQRSRRGRVTCSRGPPAAMAHARPHLTSVVAKFAPMASVRCAVRTVGAGLARRVCTHRSAASPVSRTWIAPSFAAPCALAPFVVARAHVADAKRCHRQCTGMRGFATAITRVPGRGIGWPDAPADHAVRFLELPDGSRASYCDSGEPHTCGGDGSSNAPLIIALHGAPGSHRDFRYLAAALEAPAHETAPRGGAVRRDCGPCRVVRVNMPGHGDTPLDAAPRLHGSAGGDVTPVGMAAFVEAFVEAWRAQEGVGAATRPAVLLAHSIGSTTSLELLATPKRARSVGVSGLALLAPVAMRVHQGVRPYAVVQHASTMLSNPATSWLVKPLLAFAYVNVLGFPRSTSVRPCSRRVRCATARVGFRMCESWAPTTWCMWPRVLPATDIRNGSHDTQGSCNRVWRRGTRGSFGCARGTRPML